VFYHFDAFVPDLRRFLRLVRSKPGLFHPDPEVTPKSGSSRS